MKPTYALDVDATLSHCVCNKVVLLGFREVIIPEEMKGKLKANPYQSMIGTNTEKEFRSWAVVLLDQALEQKLPPEHRRSTAATTTNKMPTITTVTQSLAGKDIDLFNNFEAQP